MPKNVTITVLVEERSHRHDLAAEHGWAVWIETGSRCILFDLGQSAKIVANADALNVDLKKCDTVALSHGHYDHSGGLETVFPLVKARNVYAHPMSLDQKFALNDDGTSRYNGMPQLCREVLERNPTTLVKTTTPTDLGSGFWLTGEIPRNTGFEDSGGQYFSDPQCLEPDPITDDQALFFESGNGLVVILGCAHAGVINTINYIREITGNKSIHAVIGGMHLIHGSDARVQSTIKEFESVRPSIICLSHCTGSAASEKLRSAFPNTCQECFTGSVFSFTVP